MFSCKFFFDFFFFAIAWHIIPVNLPVIYCRGVILNYLQYTIVRTTVSYLFWYVKMFAFLLNIWSIWYPSMVKFVLCLVHAVENVFVDYEKRLDFNAEILLKYEQCTLLSKLSRTCNQELGVWSLKVKTLKLVTVCLCVCIYMIMYKIVDAK